MKKILTTNKNSLEVVVLKFLETILVLQHFNSKM